MTLDMFVVWVLVGLLAGWLARFVLKGGAYGLIGDLILGMVGSVVAGWIFRTLGILPGAGMLTMAVVGFAGAASVLIAQDKPWHRPTVRPRRRRSVASGAWRVE